MGETDGKHNEDAMEELIEAQLEAALARFRASHFRERLERRIQPAVTPTSHTSLLRAVPRPVWVLTAFVILLGGSFLVDRFLRTPAPGASPTIETFLRQLPGMQAIENRPRPVSGPETLPPSLLEKQVASALASAAPPTRMPPESEPCGTPLSLIRRQAKPLALQELYDILILDRSVERVLTSIFQKTKEG
jgi:hypothetical protein